MPRVRVCFRYGDRRLFARAITLLRGGDSAHCEVAWAWGGQAHHCVSSSWLDGGVRGRLIEMPAGKWRIYEIDATQHPYEWLAARQGAGYDVLGLIGILWPRIGHRRRRWFCSEAVADMLGLPQPQLFDLRTLESVCAKYGERVQ